MFLGEILVKDYRVPELDVRRALHFQRTSGTEMRLGEILLKLKVLPRRELLAALGQQLGIPVVVGLARMPAPRASLLALVTRTFCESRGCVPLSLSGPESSRTLLLAMADPTDAITVDVVERATGVVVTPVIALADEITRAIEAFYANRPSVERAVDRLTPPPRRHHPPPVRGAGSDGVRMPRPTTPTVRSQPRPATAATRTPTPRTPAPRRASPASPTTPRRPAPTRRSPRRP